MIVGVPRESFPGERRVALTPALVSSLLTAGLEVRLESGAGEAAGFSDEAYREKGAVVLPREEVFAAGLLLRVRSHRQEAGGEPADLDGLSASQAVIGFSDPLGDPEAAERLAGRNVTAFAMELMPRITRAQSMDALSSQATIAGYKAAVLAAQHAAKMFPKLTTAAGTLAPVKALVVGAGVAGLQAIATSRRLGAVVEAYDVRPAVREQVQSLGAKFVELPLDAGEAEDTGGYAAAQEETFYRRQRELMARVVAASDVVITTAVVPGRRAPVLITADMVAEMAAGSVIVDLAAEQGGNCELTRADQVVTERGVTIVGHTNLAASVPQHASQMYARNVTAFVLHLVRDGELRLDRTDQITRETLVSHAGELVHPRVREALDNRRRAVGEPSTPMAAPVR